MLKIVKSVLGSTEEDKYLVISSILEDSEKNLNPQELKVFQFLKQGYETYSQFQTESLFITQFPEYKNALQEITPLENDSLDYYKREFIERHKRIAISKRLLAMANDIQQSGLTPDMVETLRDSVTGELDTELSFDCSDVVTLYEEAKSRDNKGITTGVNELDELIGHIGKGTVSVVAGASGQGKSTWAINMAYNAAKNGLHIVYISLEMAERDILNKFISLHSRECNLGTEPISYEDIRRCRLTQKQEGVLKLVHDDFKEKILPNFHLLTERHFKDFSYGEVRDILYRVDAIKPIFGVFLDHANLLKYYVKGKFSNTGDAINEYVSFFRKLSICFKVEKGVDRQIAVVLLAQVNRAGESKAQEAGKKDPSREGRYDTSSISESHELVRASSFVFTIYSSDEMKLSQEARVQLLKNRFGYPHEIPCVVSMEADYGKFGNFDGIDSESVHSDFLPECNSFDSFLNIDPIDCGFELRPIDTSSIIE